MIIVFEGTPGSGKSYEAVVRILDNLRKGREVFVYLDGMDNKSCRELIGVFSDLYGKLDDRLHCIEPAEIPTFFDNLPAGAFIVLDEVHKWFGAREWNTTKNKRFADYCSTHRHHGHDILLITQDINGLDSAVRRLVEWTYRYRKINFLGSMVSNKYIEYVYPQDSVTSAAMSRKTKTYDKKVFACYQSYAHQGIKEQKIMKAKNILRHPVFLAIPILLGLGAWQFSRSSLMRGDWFGTKRIVKAAEAAEIKKPVNEGGAPVIGNSPKIEMKDGKPVVVLGEKEKGEIADFNKELAGKGAVAVASPYPKTRIVKLADGTIELWEDGEKKGWIRVIN